MHKIINAAYAARFDGYDFLLPYYRYFVTLDGDPDPRDT